MIRFKKYLLGMSLSIMLIMSPLAFAQDGLFISAKGGYALPLGQLSKWFKSGLEAQLEIGMSSEYGWDVGALFEYCDFSQENLSGYPKDKLKLRLQHLTVWANGSYPLAGGSNFEVRLNLAGGPLYWKGIRGEIQENADLNIPHIPEKVLSEWNMGFRAGLATNLNFGRLGVEFSAGYRMVFGSLWPTMQEYIELDGVNGFQSVSLQLGMHYQF
jgi:hypothetical protein